MKRLLSILLPTILLTGGITNANPQHDHHSNISPDISGVWSSEGAEDAGNKTYSTRVFEIGKDKWNITFTMYGDKELKYPLFKALFEGDYKLEDPSKKINGAYNGIFKINKKSLTLLNDSPELVKQLGFSTCDLKKDMAVDISKGGCSFLKSVADYNKEYDVVKMENNKLYFGARPVDNDLSKVEKRPVKLNYPLVKTGENVLDK